MTVTDAELDWLQAISDAAGRAPWKAMIEGRDHEAGDDFIMVGIPGALEPDLYVWREGTPADAEILELIAASRTYLPRLIDEIRKLRYRVEV